MVRISKILRLTKKSEYGIKQNVEYQNSLSLGGKTNKCQKCNS